MTIQSCLFVTKEFSATPTSGGQLRTLALLDVLSQRYRVTIVSPDGVVIREHGSAAATTTTAEGGSAAGDRWWTALRRYRSVSGARIGGHRLLRHLRSVGGRPFDVAVIDHTCLAGLVPDVAAHAREVVVSMHNVESDLMAQRSRAATSPVEKATMAVETHLLRRLEAAVVSRAIVIVTTEADAAALRPKITRLDGGRMVVCRNGIFTPDDPLPGTPRPRSMVFSGALDWGPNVDGVLWFFDQVWPLVRAEISDAQITVAGRRPSEAIAQACRAPGVRLLADPAQMTPVLHEHAVGVVPLLSGGGSRIKILEYLDAGLDIVSTEVGASGLDDIPATLIDRVPSDAQALAAALVARLRDPHQQAATARSWVREHYSWAATLQPLLDAVTVAATPATATPRSAPARMAEETL